MPSRTAAKADLSGDSNLPHASTLTWQILQIFEASRQDDERFRPAMTLAWKSSMQPRCFVYVLESVADPGRHYVGLAADVAARVDEHNAGKAAHTGKHRPWRLRAAIGFFHPDLAARFEKYLKSGSGRAFAKRHF
jgi:putative endonuclease